MGDSGKVTITLNKIFDQPDAACVQRERLFLYAENYLPDPEKEEFQEHLRTCFCCTKTLISLRETKQMADTAKLNEESAKKIYHENLVYLKSAEDKRRSPEPVRESREFAAQGPLRSLFVSPRSIYASVLLIGASLLIIYLAYRGITANKRVANTNHPLSAKEQTVRDLSKQLAEYKSVTAQLSNKYKDQVAQIEQTLRVEQQRSEELSKTLEDYKKKQSSWVYLSPEQAKNMLSGKEVDPKLQHLFSSKTTFTALGPSERVKTIKLYFTKQQPLYNIVVITKSKEATAFLIQLSKQNQVLWSDTISLPAELPSGLWAIQLHEGYFPSDGDYQLHVYERKDDQSVLQGVYLLIIRKANTQAVALPTEGH